MRKKELILFSGIPASGKTAFYHEHFSKTHSHVSRDLQGSQAKETLELMKLIAEEKSIVIDNTNQTRETRAQYIEIGQANGYSIAGYEFRVSVKDAIKRNALREKPVNPVAIYVAKKRIVKLGLNEGFDEIVVVDQNKKLATRKKRGT